MRELNRLIQAVTQAYETYQFHRVFQLAHTFCSINLSALYLDVVKDRLYCSGANDPARRSAQTACHHILDALLRMLAPILAFTTEEAWEAAKLGPEKSVHLARFPEPQAAWEAPELAESWDKLLELRAEVGKVLEEKRRAKEIGHSLDAAVTIWARDAEDEGFLRNNVALLKKLVIVSRIQVEPPQEGAAATWRVEACKAPGVKCERCWMYDPQVGEDARHPGLCPRCADVVRRMG
jgi:isoleucyl-tRNA synthetase